MALRDEESGRERWFPDIWNKIPIEEDTNQQGPQWENGNGGFHLSPGTFSERSSELWKEHGNLPSQDGIWVRMAIVYCIGSDGQPNRYYVVQQ